MRILITNLYFGGRTGTEIVTAELANGLRRRGHDVAVYSPLIGAAAETVRRQGIAVIDALAQVPWTPDIIHGHHNVVVAAALLRFPRAPAVYVSHSPVYWVEGPLQLSRFGRVLAVSEACRERLIAEDDPARAEIELLLNAVDLDRFRLRPPLPEKPRRALALTKNRTHLSAVRVAARTAGLELDELGPGVGRVVDDLHMRLCDYDIVFATGRMALEALASGCAVIVADARGLAGLVRSDVVDIWRRHNLGQRLLTRECSAAELAVELRGYDASDARAVSNRIRDTASLSDYIDRVQSIHQAVVANRIERDLEADARELAAFYETFLKRLGEAANVDQLDIVRARLQAFEAGEHIFPAVLRRLKRRGRAALARLRRRPRAIGSDAS